MVTRRQLAFNLLAFNLFAKQRFCGRKPEQDLTYGLQISTRWDEEAVYSGISREMLYRLRFFAMDDDEINFSVVIDEFICRYDFGEFIELDELSFPREEVDGWEYLDDSICRWDADGSFIVYNGQRISQ